MKHKPHVTIICVSFLFLFGFISLSILQNQSTKHEQAVPLTYNWYYSLNGKSPVSLSIPTHVDCYYHKGDTVDLYTTLPTTSIKQPYLRTKIFLQHVKIFLDDELLYTYDGNINTSGNLEVGSGLLVFPLPKDYAYKTLHIQYIHSFDRITNYIFPITLTEKNLTETLLFDSAETIYLNSWFLLTGIVCLLVSLYLKFQKQPYLSFLFLGIFAIIYSIWLLCNTKCLQLFTQNLAFIHHLEYLCFYAIAIPLWLFFYQIVSKHSLKLYCFISTLPAIVFYIIAIILQYMDKANFFELLPAYHLLLGGNLLLMIIFISLLIYKKHPLSQGLLVGILCLILSGILEIVKFYATNIKVTSFINYGIILFFFNLIYALYRPKNLTKSKTTHF